MQKLTSNPTEANFLDYIASSDRIGCLKQLEKSKLINYIHDVSSAKGFIDAKNKAEYSQSIHHTLRGEYDKAIPQVLRVLPYFQENDIDYEIASYTTLSNMLDDLGDFDKAKEYNAQSIKLADAKLTGDQLNYRQANNYLIQGKILVHLRQLKQAEKSLRKADSLASINFPHNVKEKCFALVSLSRIYLEAGQYRDVLNQLNKKAIPLCREYNFDDILSFAYQRVGDSYNKLGELDSALTYYNLSEEVSAKGGFASVQSSVLLRRSNLFEKKGDIQKALADKKKFIEADQALMARNEEGKNNYLLNQVKQEEEARLQEKLDETSRKNKNRVRLITLSGIGLLIILGILFLVNRWRQNKLVHQQELAQERLQSELKESQLMALQSQMNPHFIFNCLNSIQSMILDNDARQSSKYLAMFSNIVRKFLENGSVEFITISEEMDLLETYLELEQLRFKNLNFEVSSSLTEEEKSFIKVPAMLIQPFVENSLKHGLLHTDNERKLLIRFESEENDLNIYVKDNGIGRTEALKIKKRQKTHKSFSTGAIAKRIKLMNERGLVKVNLKISDHLPKEDGWSTIVHLHFDQ